MKNYEKIKQMSIDEMAEFLIDVSNGICNKCLADSCIGFECLKGVYDWLESEEV